MNRFWQKVDIKTPIDCWLWSASVMSKFNYGKFWLKGKIHAAHRVSWELEFGSIPSGLCVLHKCDNPKCVNPWHLFLGTKIDNNRDAMIKGRIRHRKNSALISAVKIDYNKMYITDIAKKYDVSPRSIRRWLSL